MEVRLAENSASTFASRAQAETFLSEALPAATAANPKYRTPGADYDRRWLIKTVTFSRAEDGGVVVSLDEDFEDYRNGAIASRDAHEARFAIDDVAISLETTDDATERGEKAKGVLFQCIGRPLRPRGLGRKAVGQRQDRHLYPGCEPAGANPVRFSGAAEQGGLSLGVRHGL